MKKIMKLILCLMCLMMAFGCAKDSPTDDKPTPTPTPTPAQDEVVIETLEDAGITVENLKWSNLMSYLLYDHETVQTIHESEGYRFIEGYFLCNEKRVTLFSTIDPSGFMECSGYYDRYYWWMDDDRIVAEFSVEWLHEETDAYNPEEAVSNIFEECEVTLEQIDETEVILHLDGLYIDSTVTVDRETLDVLRVESYMSEEESYVIDYIYDDYIEGSGLFEAWSGPMKQVTVITDLYLDGDYLSVTKTLEVPHDWELIPTFFGELAVYMDEAFTDPYVYPGHGIDYTIYVTNTMG